MTKPLFISYLEKENNKIFSCIICNESISIQKIEEKKLNLLWSDSEYDSEKVLFLDRIYKTQHPFYIYVMTNRQNKSEGQILVYYESEQLKELMFFIKPFIKSLKK